MGIRNSKKTCILERLDLMVRWSLVNNRQGYSSEETIPPLNRENGTVATINQKKADLLANKFAAKMQVPDPERQPPYLAPSTVSRMTAVGIHQVEVLQLLKTLDTSKAVGPDKVSPRLLRSCADLFAPPLTCLFQLGLDQGMWPSLWKMADVVPVHNKKSRSVVGNYRPVSVLSITGKIIES
ncbi:uncharacterized protein [Procambarus clarkii]|uniref:uncharacterized protein n=1 Tax=Procambarus clarkii TaxID=6728 RepID=UPI003742FC33